MLSTLLMFWFLFCCACSRRPAAPGGLTFYVGIECHPKAKMAGCDQAEPPSCKTIALTYDKACEQLVATTLKH